MDFVVDSVRYGAFEEIFGCDTFERLWHNDSYEAKLKPFKLTPYHCAALHGNLENLKILLDTFWTSSGLAHEDFVLRGKRHSVTADIIPQSKINSNKWSKTRLIVFGALNFLKPHCLEITP